MRMARAVAAVRMHITCYEGIIHPATAVELQRLMIILYVPLFHCFILVVCID
jgi:hypothetical protein